MNKHQPDKWATANRHKLLLYHIPVLSIWALTLYLLSFELDTHSAIFNRIEIVEYRPRLTFATVLALGVSIMFGIFYYGIFLLPRKKRTLDRWFYLAVLALPLLAGLAEYALVQYRLNANNYERCYAVSFGERDYKPFFAEIVRKQVWLRGGGCKVGSWSDD